MKTRNVLSAALVSLIAAASRGAQAADDLTRDQVRAELAAFQQTHHYDTFSERYVPNTPDTAAPADRAGVKTALAEFQRTHHYDTFLSSTVPNRPAPLAAISRSEVKAELAQFQRNYHYDSFAERYVPNKKSL